MTERSILVGATYDELDQFLEGELTADPDEHATAAAWVFDEAVQHVLLVHHRLQGWSCPGGHIEPGESPPEAAARELLEETGVVAHFPSATPLVVTASVGCARRAGARHWTMGFLAHADRRVPLRAEPDQPARWWPLDALPSPRPDDIDIVVARLRPAT